MQGRQLCHPPLQSAAPRGTDSPHRTMQGDNSSWGTQVDGAGSSRKGRVLARPWGLLSTQAGRGFLQTLLHRAGQEHPKGTKCSLLFPQPLC